MVISATCSVILQIQGKSHLSLKDWMVVIWKQILAGEMKAVRMKVKKVKTLPMTNKDVPWEVPEPSPEYDKDNIGSILDTLCTCLELMANFLQIYRLHGYKGWIAASQQAAMISRKEKPNWMAQWLQEWTHNFVCDPKDLPEHEYGKFCSSVLEDEDLAHEICVMKVPFPFSFSLFHKSTHGYCAYRH
jgi:hypothetical protein